MDVQKERNCKKNILKFETCKYNMKIKLKLDRVFHVTRSLKVFFVAISVEVGKCMSNNNFWCNNNNILCS